MGKPQLMPIPSKQGFTLLEILIASSILVAMMTAAYNIYRVVAKTQAMGHWSTMAATQLRNGLILIRNEITRATEPTNVTQKGTIPVGDAKYRILYGPPTNPFSDDFKSGDKKLVEFFMSQPGKAGVPGVTDEGYEIMQGLLEISGGRLVYSRTMISQQNVVKPTQELTQVICENPVKIDISFRQVTGQLSVKDRNFINIAVVAQHPNFQETKVTESGEAAFEVDLQLGGHP